MPTDFDSNTLQSGDVTAFGGFSAAALQFANAAGVAIFDLRWTFLPNVSL